MLLGTTFSLVTGYLFEGASVDLYCVSYGLCLGEHFTFLFHLFSDLLSSEIQSASFYPLASGVSIF